MRDVMWILIGIIFLAKAWSQDPGTNESTPVNSSTSSRPLAISVQRHETFKLGSQANLTCSEKTWSETLFVIWKMNLKEKNCSIKFELGQNIDDCEDGKSLRNTSTSQSFLHIPKLSPKDVGVYKCEFVYSGGRELHIIHVAITVPPEISARLETHNKKTVAVCRAERGNPAANISWSHTGNLLSYDSSPQSDGYFTVESRLELPEYTDPSNLSCVISHPSWDKIHTLKPHTEVVFPWILCISIVVVLIVVLAGSILFARKKIKMRRSQQSDTTSSKSPPTEDVEEVEPYASYIQRVNSIYNSSADLFA